MRRLLYLFGFLAVGSHAYAAALQSPPDWREIDAAAAACSVKIIRYPPPEDLTALQLGPGYSFDQRSTPEQRKCFYRKLNMPEGEQALREYQFEK